ncbi:4Fe-4S binding protein [bacterium]|nr:4Fe-4S binding protein [bacterium]
MNSKTTQENGVTFILRRLQMVGIFPFYFQVGALVIFVIIISLLFVTDKFKMVNYGMELTWNILWPLFPLSLLLFGKILCSVCPISFVNVFIERFNRRFDFLSGLSHKYITGRSIAFAMAVLVAVCVGSINVNKSSGLTFVLLLLFPFTAVLVILFVSKTLFCKSVCPVGFITWIYSRFSIIRIETCGEGCPDSFMYQEEDCLKNCSRNKVGLSLNPPLMRDTYPDVAFPEIFFPPVLIAILCLFQFNYSYIMFLFEGAAESFPLIINSFHTFIVLLVLLTCLAALFISGFFYSISNLFVRDQTLLKRSFFCLVPIAILFHIYSMLRQFVSMSAVSTAMNLNTLLKSITASSIENVFIITGFLFITLGTLLTCRSFQLLIRKTGKTGPNAILFQVFMYCYFSLFVFIAVYTVKYTIVR